MVRSGLSSAIKLVSGFFSHDWLVRQSGRNLLLPFYHTVSDCLPIHIKNIYPVINTRTFVEDLDFFMRHYRPVDLSFLSQQLRVGKEISQPVFSLTFDDGLREFHDIVAPILIQKGIPACCFVNPAFVDNKELFFRNKVSILIEKIRVKPLSPAQQSVFKFHFNAYGMKYRGVSDLFCITDRCKGLLDELAACVEISFLDYLSSERPYMTTNELKGLANKGFTIGAHSLNHPYYADLNEKEQLTETFESLKWVNDHIAGNSRFFAFPYTDYKVSKSFFDQIRSEVDLSFGTANLKEDSIITNLQRIPMEINGRTTAESLVKGQYLSHIIKKMLHKQIIFRG